MRLRRILLFALFLSGLLCFPVRAAEAEEIRDRIYLESGADELFRNLPEEVQDLFREKGISPKEPGAKASSIFEMLSEAVQAEGKAPLQTLFLLISVAVLSAAVSEYASDDLRFPAALCGAAAAAGILLPRISALLSQAETILKADETFLAAAIPVYAGLLTASGSAAAGTSYGALTLFAANAVSVLSAGVFLPLMGVLPVLAAVSSVTAFDMGRLTDRLYKAAKWVLLCAVTVFSGVLSVQTLVIAETDALAGKTAKFIASSAVPIVGGAIGDAVTAIAGSVSLVKSGAGAFGLLASLAIFLPLCVKAAAWLAVCLAASFAAEMFGEKHLSAFLNGCAAALRLLIAVVCSVAAVSVVCAAILLCVRGAYA